MNDILRHMEVEDVLIPIFYGTRASTSIKGRVERITCPRCQNHTQWTLIRVIRWAYCFPIPPVIFPFSWKYFCTCPACESAIEMKKADFKALVAQNGEGRHPLALQQERAGAWAVQPTDRIQ